MIKDDTPSRRQKRSRKDIIQATQAALENENVRLFLRWLIERTEMFQLPDHESPDFHNGRRSVGLEIVALLNEISPYEFVRLMKEGADDVVRQQAENRRNENASID